jgi:hypothetical protein
MPLGQSVADGCHQLLVLQHLIGVDHRSCIILKNDPDSRAHVNARSEKISEKLQPAGPSDQVGSDPFVLAASG